MLGYSALARVLWACCYAASTTPHMIRGISHVWSHKRCRIIYTLSFNTSREYDDSHLSSSGFPAHGWVCWARRCGSSHWHNPRIRAHTPHGERCFLPGPGAPVRPSSLQGPSLRWAGSSTWPDATASTDSRIKLASDKTLLCRSILANDKNTWK